MKNKYVERSKISEAKFRTIVKSFALDLTATQTAEMAGVSRSTVNRGRDAGDKTIVFGLYKRNGKVYTEIVPDAASHTLQRIIRGRANIDSVIHSDGWRGYDGLVDLGYEKHFHVDRGKNEFSDTKGNHINGIEGFWGYATHRLMKFKGIPKEHFQLHLLKTEFRFNHRHVDLYQLLLKMFRDFPLSVSLP